jgi:hypothetical protein
MKSAQTPPAFAPHDPYSLLTRRIAHERAVIAGLSPRMATVYGWLTKLVLVIAQLSGPTPEVAR